MIGGAPMLGRRYGTKEIAKVYVGDERIWPPIQIPQLIGSLIYVNAATGVFPPHQAGDILVVIAVSAGATPPSLPAGFISAYTSPSTDFSIDKGVQKWGSSQIHPPGFLGTSPIWRPCAANIKNRSGFRSP